MIISVIAAIAINRVIGMNNCIPWHISADLSWFKRNTIYKPIIMGRKTFESIGKPLPERYNIVLSNSPPHHDNDVVTWATTPLHALELIMNKKVSKKEGEVMIIGGGKIYETFLPQAQRLYLTHIDIQVKGDTFFPHYVSKEWKLIFRENHHANKKKYQYCFEILERI